MRPTLKQLYTDPKAIIAALEAAGFENAHAKVMGIMLPLCEYWSMHRYYERLDRDRTYALQSEHRRMSKTGAVADPNQALRNQKQAGEYNRTLIVARGYLKRQARRLENKIAKWPELDLDPGTLRKKPDQTLISRVIKGRQNKKRPRVLVLG